MYVAMIQNSNDIPIAIIATNNWTQPGTVESASIWSFFRDECRKTVLVLANGWTKEKKCH